MITSCDAWAVGTQRDPQANPNGSMLIGHFDGTA
jgi:hypothetical protein